MAKAKKTSTSKTKTRPAAKKTAKKKAPSTKRKASSTSTKKSATKKKASAKKSSKVSEEIAEDSVTLDRRKADRRDEPVAEASTTDKKSKIERREKVNRRRQIDPTTCERDYTEEEVEFMNAMELYKRRSGRMFPTCSEVLEVLRGMGYVRRSDLELELVAGHSVSPEAEAIGSTESVMAPIAASEVGFDQAMPTS